ncbi:MAG: FHA domain-containing protein [Armatimonadota bacterium]|nr:FHA domain-containing protein [Armatimonadota bacterium]
MGLKSKIILNSLFGAAGGFIGWTVIEVVLRGFFAVPMDEHQPGQIVVANAEFGVLAGIFIGGMLGAADGLWAQSKAMLGRTVVVGAVAGAVSGLLGLTVAQSVFDLFVRDTSKHTLGTFIMLVIGHAVAWTIVGGALGVAQGVIEFSAIRAKHGTIGGIIGGFIGGMSFDVVANILRVESLSRMVSLTLTGFTIGLMIGLIQDLLKQAWVVVLKGSNEGREIPIYKPVVSIGRDELADIPIYADRTVGPRHASIRRQNNRHALEDAGSALGTYVNGQRTSKQMLKDRDVIEIGSVKLLFREKATASRFAAPPELPLADEARIPVSSHICPFCGGVKDASGNCDCTVAAGPVSAQASAPTQVSPAPLPPGPAQIPSAPRTVAPGPVPSSGRLVATTGPHASMTFDLAAETSIGREAGRDVCLSSDMAASRRHARVVKEDQGFVLYDEGSSNGTFLNGARVTRAVLSPGDTITVGATELRFETA